LAAESEFGVLFLLLSVFFKIFTILHIFFSKYLISQIFLLTYITTFEPETPAGHPKYQKTRNVAQFPVKTSAKYYHLTVGAQGQAKWAKVA